MNSLDFALIIALTLSLSLNGLLVWYTRKTTNRLLYISENLNDLISLVGVFREHLEAIYQMEMFYGDETLSHLIGHTKSLYNILEDYEDIVYLTEPIEFTFDETQEDDDNDQKENEEIQFPEEDVLYAGARRRNS